MAVRFRTQQVHTAVTIVLVFVIVTMGMLSIGLRSSLERWRGEHGVDFDAFLTDRLQGLLETGGDVDPAMIADYLTPYLDPTLYAIVFDDDDRLIFWTWKGDSWYWRSETTSRPGPDAAERLLTKKVRDDLKIDPEGMSLADQFRFRGVLHDVSSEGRRLGSFVAGSNGFTVNRTNRRLLETLAKSTFFGLGIAIILVLLLSTLWGRRVDAAIRAITTAMRRIADGSRSESFPESNIVELGEIAASAESLQRELARAEQLRRQWTMDIAHDLRTPVANLQAQIEAISDGLLEPTPERLAGFAVHTRKLSVLTDDLLLLCRVESPDYRPEISKIPLYRIAEQIETGFGARTAKAGRTLEIHATDDHVIADEKLLERATANLVENALRHGTGTIRCRFTAGRIEVINGGAISPETLERMFDRMYRESPDRGGDGHGLGLSIAKAIVDLHGHRLTVNNIDAEVVASITWCHE